MSGLRLFFILFGLLVITAHPLFAVTQNQTTRTLVPNQIVLEGHDIDYDQAKGILLASQNVTLTHRHYEIKTEAIQYDSQEELIEFPATFNIYGKGYNFNAAHFHYDFEKRSGKALELNGHIAGLNLTGSDIEFYPESVVMRDAMFTSCTDNVNPHYKLESKRLIIYPKFGFMVAFDNWMSVSLLPFPIWIPSYVYGSDLSSLSASPLPEFGSNEREGFYVKQKFAYFLNQKSNGTVMVGTTNRMGIHTGVFHNQILDEDSILYAKLHYYGTEEWAGGLMYRRDIPKDVGPEDDVNFDIFDQSRTRYGQFYAKWLSKELIHDSLVDYNPQIGVSLDETELGIGAWHAFGDVSLGHIREDRFDETVVSDYQGNLNLILKDESRWTERFVFQKDINFFGYWYSAKQRWLRLFSRVSLEYDWDLLKPKLFYRNVHTQTGNSPFEFQRIYATEENEYGMSLTTRIGDWETGIKAEYIARTGDRKRFEYVNSYRFHCWEISLNWESVQERLSLGFNFTQ